MTGSDRLVRLYELMGAEVDRDAGTVKLNASLRAKPVHLVVKVQPVGLESPSSFETRVQVNVLLDAEYAVVGRQIEQNYFDESLSLPVSQLRFLADEPDLEVTDAMVEAFKAGWHEADDQGRDGERTRAGLAAAMAAVER